jgi:hypothetical protein
MAQMTGFFRDRRGVALVDYGFVAMLVMLCSHLAARWGDTVSLPLRHLLLTVGVT